VSELEQDLARKIFVDGFVELPKTPSREAFTLFVAIGGGESQYRGSVPVL
jgi:hypothetical protein